MVITEAILHFGVKHHHFIIRATLNHPQWARTL